MVNDSNQLILSNFFSTENIKQINIVELVTILQNKTFQFDLKSDSSLPTQLLESSNLDINNCVSNCSNQGLCRLNSQLRNQFECLCNSNFTGPKCESDKRLCSQNPCLNSIHCEDILTIQTNSSLSSSFDYDFKCHCKSELYYGERCESKVNLCQNETCSGNGICKVIQTGQDGLNETIKCECFGQNSFEGDKCELKTSSTKIKEATTKTTVYVAIITVALFYTMVFVMDIHKYFIMNKKMNKPRRPRIK